MLEYFRKDLFMERKKMFINWENLDGAAKLLNRFPRTSQLTRVGANKMFQLNTQPLNDFIECQINISGFTVESRASLDLIGHTTNVHCCTNDILMRDKKSPKKVPRHLKSVASHRRSQNKLSKMKIKQKEFFFNKSFISCANLLALEMMKKKLSKWKCISLETRLWLKRWKIMTQRGPEVDSKEKKKLQSNFPARYFFNRRIAWKNLDSIVAKRFPPSLSRSVRREEIF